MHILVYCFVYYCDVTLISSNIWRCRSRLNVNLNLSIDNVTLPTTVQGLASVFEPHSLIRLASISTIRNPDLPRYLLVGESGYYLYAKATPAQKLLAADKLCELGPTVVPSGNTSPTLLSGRIPVTFADLSISLVSANIIHVAIVAFGMKAKLSLNILGDLPLSSDRSVTRRYDIGLNYSSDNIPLIALSPIGRNSEGAQVPMLNQNVGSVEYQLHLCNTDCKMVVYPRLLHLVKAHLPGGYQMPTNIKAFRKRFEAVYSCICKLSTISNRNYRLLTGYRAEITVVTNLSIAPGKTGNNECFHITTTRLLCSNGSICS